MANTWYLIKIKKDLPKLDKFKYSTNLFVKLSSEDEIENVTFTVWNGGIDGIKDFEHLNLNEAIDHLESVKDNKGKALKIEDENLDLKWFQCIHPDWKYRNRT